MYAIKEPEKHLRVAEEKAEHPLREHLAWFARVFATDEDCLEAMLAAAKINTTSCHHCNSGQIEREYGSRTGLCTSCGRVTYVTAGTFFDHMRKPRTWWCIIVTLASKIEFSAKSLWDFLGGSYFTIWRLIQNVAMAIEQRMTQLTLAITSGSFLPAICRRSKETPKGVHPRIEEQAAQEENTRHVAVDLSAPASHAITSQLAPREESSDADESDTIQSSVDLEEAVATSLAHTGPIAFERLSILTAIDAPMLSATLTLMQFAGTVVRVGGDHFMLRSPIAATVGSPVLNSCCRNHRDDATSIIENTIKHLKTVHRGISRKYLQRYACLYWCQSSTSWTLENILSACMEIGELEVQRITDYVSPLSINVLVCSSAVSQTAS